MVEVPGRHDLYLKVCVHRVLVRLIYVQRRNQAVRQLCQRIAQLRWHIYARSLSVRLHRDPIGAYGAYRR